MAGAPKDAGGLTAKQRLFALEYLVDANATAAAIRAGYSEQSARVTGLETLRKPAVAQLVQSALARRVAKLDLSAEQVLRELQRIALVDVGQAFGPDGVMLALAEMPEDVRRCIQSVDVEEISGPEGAVLGTLRKVKFWNKNHGLETLAKHLGLLDVKIKIEIGLTDEQMRDELATIVLGAVGASAALAGSGATSGGPDAPAGARGALGDGSGGEE